MTIEVTFSEEIGGDGSSFNDGSGPGGMDAGGYLDNWFPMLQQAVTVLAFMVDRVAEAANYANTAVNSPATQATTNTPVTVSLGSKTITLQQSGKAFAKSQRIRIASDANVANFVEGAATTGPYPTMTVNVDTIGGSGSFSDGIVTPTGGGGVPGSRKITATGLAAGGGDLSADRTVDVPKASIAEIRAGLVQKPATVADQAAALAEVTLQFGANITTPGDAILDAKRFVCGRVVMTGDAFLPNLTDATPGTYRIAIVQDSIGNRKLTGWGGMYRRTGSKPTLSTAPGAVDYLEIDVVNAGEAIVGFVGAPTN